MHQGAFAALDGMGLDRADVAAIAVFRTQHPAAVTERLLEAASRLSGNNAPRLVRASWMETAPHRGRATPTSYTTIRGYYCTPNFQDDIDRAPFLDGGGEARDRRRRHAPASSLCRRGAAIGPRTAAPSCGRASSSRSRTRRCPPPAFPADALGARDGRRTPSASSARRISPAGPRRRASPSSRPTSPFTAETIPRGAAPRQLATRAGRPQDRGACRSHRARQGDQRARLLQPASSWRRPRQPPSGRGRWARAPSPRRVDGLFARQGLERRVAARLRFAPAAPLRRAPPLLCRTLAGQPVGRGARRARSARPRRRRCSRAAAATRGSEIVRRKDLLDHHDARRPPLAWPMASSTSFIRSFRSRRPSPIRSIRRRTRASIGSRAPAASRSVSLHFPRA